MNPFFGYFPKKIIKNPKTVANKIKSGSFFLKKIYPNVNT